MDGGEGPDPGGYDNNGNLLATHYPHSTIGYTYDQLEPAVDHERWGGEPHVQLRQFRGVRLGAGLGDRSRGRR